MDEFHKCLSKAYYVSSPIGHSEACHLIRTHRKPEWQFEHDPETEHHAVESHTGFFGNTQKYPLLETGGQRVEASQRKRSLNWALELSRRIQRGNKDPMFENYNQSNESHLLWSWESSFSWRQSNEAFVGEGLESCSHGRVQVVLCQPSP